MTSLHLPSPQEQTHQATRAILNELHALTHRGLVVDAPPGAGKSTLVVQAAGTLAQPGAPCVVMAQTNRQVDHLVRRFARDHPGLKIGRFTSAEHIIAADLQAHPDVRTGTRIQDLEKAAHVIVGTAMKWATVTGRRWPWAVIDEAYQMRSDVLLRTAHLFDQTLFVGDPGQLDPFSTADLPHLKGLAHDPLNSAATVLLDNNPDLPVHCLPVSWRLPAAAVPLISDAFYPATPFRAGSGEADRTLRFSATGMGTPIDEVVETAARTGWALFELPARITHRVDTEALHAVLAIAERLLVRRTVTTCEKAPDGHVLQPHDIAIGTAHRIQAHRIRALLAREYPELQGITVDTANRLQGSEFRITIVLHPLSGRGDASAFHLEAGRLCVLTSRHRHACIVVARAGIPELLDAHPATDPVHLGVTSKTPEGWEAHHAVFDRLARHTVHASARSGLRRG
ncbi:AAA domain-containing protein [Streptomyces sp. SM10]|uniref:AAA domain-containing protein n=1 Tax=Streptomyces sp. SM10 TaxID=565556 RepID=UPI0021564AFF|nr:AAA domain-containing protein [Streptomyces sp. SM10]